ncbi:MAG: AEC family transporter [Thermodesulfobacteriota bacterium]
MDTRLYLEIGNIVLPVFLIVGLGFLFGKIYRLSLTPINDLVIYVFTPCLMISSLSGDPIEVGLVGKVFASVILISGGSLLVGYLIIRALHYPIRVYLPPVAFANTGNMGLPLVLFAFGDEGLRVGILYMVGMTIVHFTAGIAILSYRESRLEVLKLPLIYAAVLGIAISLLGWQIPTPLDRSIDLLGQATIPIMIFALGYKLSEITLHEAERSFLFGGLRIGVGFLLGLLSVYVFGLRGVSSGVVMMDSAMPPAVFNFVLAEKYKQNSKVVASIIMAGTLLSLITTPIIIAFLLRK